MTETEKSNGAENKDGNDSNALTAKILRQVEFYFGDINLPKDKFLLEKVKENEGWVTMDTMLNFKRLANLSSDPAVIMDALGDSNLMEVDKENKQIRRNPEMPFPELTDERKKEINNMTVYCKGIPKDDTLDDVMPFFENLGKVSSVHMRMFVDKKDNSKGFKGSVFVTFASREEAEKFMTLDKVAYKENDLVRKWQDDYFQEKQSEFEERKKEKEEMKKKKLEDKKQKQQKNDQEDKKEAEEEELALPKGSVLHIKGLGKETKREDIKEKLGEFEVDPTEIAYVYFQMGDEEAKLRFKKENAAKEAMNKLPEELEIKDTKVEVKLIEGEEETKFLEQCVEDMKKQKSKGKGHKRKGGFQGGRGGKRQRK